MKNFKKNIIKFIAKILGVKVKVDFVNSINLSNNNLKKLDLSVIDLDDKAEVNLKYCKNLESIIVSEEQVKQNIKIKL